MMENPSPIHLKMPRVFRSKYIPPTATEEAIILHVRGKYR
jgi:hypothetical protein